MLLTKCFDDNCKMLATILAVVVTNILYLLTLVSGTNIQKMSRRLKFWYQNPKIVTIINSPTSLSPQKLRSKTGRSGVFKHFWRFKVRAPLTVVPYNKVQFGTLICHELHSNFEKISENVRRMYNFESFQTIQKDFEIGVIWLVVVVCV